MSEITELGHHQKCAKAESISDLTDIMEIDRYWADNNNKTSDDQVGISYWRVIAINWN
jgi:hypothetical protein